MLVDEFKPNAKYKNRAALVDAQALLQGADSIKDLVYSWLTVDRKVIFCPGEDDNGTRNSLCLLLREKQDEVAQIYIKLERLNTLWPDIVPLGEVSADTSTDPELDMDDLTESWFKARDVRLNVAFSDVLVAPVMRARDSIDVALSYATTEYGIATFELVGENDLSDLLDGLEPDVFNKDGLVWLSLKYMDRATRQGWGEYFYVTGGN